jgi:hypothetical protein
VSETDDFGVDPADPRRQRLRRRHTIILATVLALMVGTFGYAAAYMQGWVGQPSASVAGRCPAPSPTVRAPKPQQIKLNVYNATDEQGRATVVAKALRKRDFVINTVANDPTYNSVPGPAEVRFGTKGEPAATVVAGQVKGAKLVPDTRTDRSVDLVIGQTFTRLIPQPPKPPTPARSVTMNVYNTTFRTGLASTTAKSLAARGFRIDKVGNDPHPKILSVSGLIVYGDDGENAARRVALQVAGTKMVNDHRSGRTVDLILGNGYTGLVPISQATASPVPTTAPPTPSRKC